jgi:hypothetical protein
MARMSEVDYANRIYKCTILIDKIESRRIDEKQLIEYIEHLLIEKKYTQFEVLGYSYDELFNNHDRTIYIGVTSRSEANEMVRYLNNQIFDELELRFKISAKVIDKYIEPSFCGPNKRIFLTNVPSDMTYKDVVALMEDYGTIYDVHFQFKKDSNYPNVFFSMLGARVARDAIKEGHKAVDANEFNLRGSRMKIDFAEKQAGKTLSRVISARNQVSKENVKVGDTKPAYKIPKRSYGVASGTRVQSPADVLMVNIDNSENWDDTSVTSKKSVPSINPIETNSEEKDRRLVSKSVVRYSPPPVLQLQTVQRLKSGSNAITIEGANSEGSIKCFFIINGRVADRANISVNVEWLGGHEDVDQRQADALEQMAQSSAQFK